MTSAGRFAVTRAWFVRGFVLVLLSSSLLVTLAGGAAFWGAENQKDQIARLAGPELVAVAHSIAAATATAAVTVILAVLTAMTLITVGLGRPKFSAAAACGLLPLAIAPLLIGSTSFAFLWRGPGAWIASLWSDASRGAATVAAVEALAQIIRYLPLMVWLFFLVVLQTPFGTARYAEQVGLTSKELFRADFIRRWTPAALVVAAFAFQDAANDTLISGLAIRPSVATDTELLSHFLYRNLLLLFSSRPADEALGTVIWLSLIGAFLLAASFAFLAGGLVALVIFSRTHGLKPKGSSISPASEHGTGVGALAASGLVVSLSCASLSALRPGPAAAALILLPSAFTAALVAISSWSIAAAMVFCLRDGARLHDGSAQRTLTAASFVAVALGFLPAIGLATAIYALAFSAHLDGAVAAAPALYLGETLRFVPIVFVLLVPSSLAISDGELDHLKLNGVGLFERFGVSFFSPYRLLHAAVLLISFNMILNDGVVASVFQNQMPSLTDIMARATSGRSADYPLAGLLIVFQASFFAVLLLMWGGTTFQAWRGRHAGN